MARYNPNDYPSDKPDGGGGGGDYIPVGKHIVQVIDHELSTSGGGYGQIVVTFEDRQGRTRKGWFIYEGGAGFQLARLLSAFDFHDEIDLDRAGDVKRAIYGKNVEIVVADETYQGAPKTKIKYVNRAPPTSGQHTRSRRDETPPPHDDGPPPPGDDDIPF